MQSSSEPPVVQPASLAADRADASGGARFTARKAALLLAINLLALGLFDQAVKWIPMARLVGNVGRMLEVTGNSHPPYVRLRKGIDVEYQSPGDPNLKTRVVTNSMGFRDRERSLPRTAGLHRIIAIGDSHTFGLGVEVAEAYPTQLESALRSAGEAVEVWNAGTPGHQMRDHLGTLRSLLPSRPEIVVLQLTENDAVVPFHITPMLLELSRYSGIARQYVLYRLNSAVDVRDFLQAYTAFLEEAKRAGVSVVVWSESVPKKTRPSLEQRAAAMGADFVDPLRGEHHPQVGDETHLSPLGNRVVAERLVPVLQAALSRRPAREGQ